MGEDLTYRAIADPTLQRRASCRRRAIYPARELAVFVIFHHFFFNGSHAYISLLNTSIASLGTDEHIAKIRVSKSPILKFLWDFEICQNGPKVNVGCVSCYSSSSSSSFSSYAGSSPDFWTLSNWARVLKFWVCVWTTVLYAGFYEFLKSGPPETPGGP